MSHRIASRAASPAEDATWQAAAARTPTAREAAAREAALPAARPRVSAIRPARGSQPGYPPRTIHLLDPENLIGTASPHVSEVQDLMARYARRVGFGPMDQIVIACSHRAFKTIGFCWCGPQYLVRSGPDGADRELLRVIRYERLVSRFPDVVIGSGDGVFTEAASGLAADGSRVTIVSRRGHLARALALVAGRRVIYIDLPSDNAAGPRNHCIDAA
ncbi:MAG TPA: hypothetical protein VLX31_04000 [Streptosporangiaceae bacterium]|nr:hypothetical protein [Streptosporangiaceae bacterium]